MRSPLGSNRACSCASSASTGSGSSGAAAPSTTVFCAFTVPAAWARRVASTATRWGAENSTSMQRRLVGVVVDVDHGRHVGDDRPVGAQQAGVAQRLQRLDRCDQLRRARGDQVAGDRRVRQAHEGRHRAAALRHAVHLGLLEPPAGGVRRVVQHPGDRQHALSAHTRQHQVEVHSATTPISPLRMARISLIALISLA
jgi:hypothetical protein